LSAAEKSRIADEGNVAYAAIVAAIPFGPASPQAQAGVELWRKQMDYFWTPKKEQLLALAEMYSADLRFKANFDQIDPRLAEFMKEAVGEYVKRNEVKRKKRKAKNQREIGYELCLMEEGMKKG